MLSTIHKPPILQFRCDVEATLSVIGGKWKLMLVWYLREEPRRFNEIRRQFPEISQKVLTQQLRELEADGVVHREIFREIPPKVEYSLTAFGASLGPVMTALDEWGRGHVHQLKRLREGVAADASAVAA